MRRRPETDGPRLGFSRTLGLDLPAAVAHCRGRWPEALWIEADLECQEPLPLEPGPLAGSIIIAADVIEHLLDPLALLENLRQLLEIAPVALISTPERDLVRGAGHNGPPPNRRHVREWSIAEFEQLLEHAGLHPAHIGLTADNNLTRRMTTILAILTKDAGHDA